MNSSQDKFNRERATAIFHDVESVAEAKIDHLSIKSNTGGIDVMLGHGTLFSSEENSKIIAKIQELQSVFVKEFDYQAIHDKLQTEDFKFFQEKLKSILNSSLMQHIKELGSSNGIVYLTADKIETEMLPRNKLCMRIVMMKMIFLYIFMFILGINFHRLILILIYPEI